MNIPKAVAAKDMSFVDHLEDLRWHIIRSIIAVIILTIASFVKVDWIFNNIILAPAKANFITWRALCGIGGIFNMPDLCIQDINLELQSRFMTGQFTITIIAAFILGIVIAFPYIVWELWRFVKPALDIKEQRSSYGAVASISILFASGISFGYFIIAPLMVYVMVSYQISSLIVNQFDITSYVSTFVSLVFGSGILFQLPVVIYFLSKMGIVTPMLLRKYRKHSIVAILVIAAIITPPDPLSQVLITLPLYLLFEISILISAKVYYSKLKAELV